MKNLLTLLEIFVKLTDAAVNAKISTTAKAMTVEDYGATPKPTTTVEDHRRRRFSRRTLVVATMCAIFFIIIGGVGVRVAQTTEDARLEGVFDVEDYHRAGLSESDEALARDDFGAFLTVLGERARARDADAMSQAELGVWNAHRAKCERHIFRACKIRRGVDCWRCRANPWWHRIGLIAGCKKFHCWIHN